MRFRMFTGIFDLNPLFLSLHPTARIEDRKLQNPLPPHPINCKTRYCGRVYKTLLLVQCYRTSIPGANAHTVTGMPIPGMPDSTFPLNQTLYCKSCQMYINFRIRFDDINPSGGTLPSNEGQRHYEYLIGVFVCLLKIEGTVVGSR